jgi:hypothetical protein
LPEDVVAVLSSRSPQPTTTGDPGEFPLLITHQWCPFTSPAETLWQEAASANGQSLHVVFAESSEGECLITTLNVRGVPCLAKSEAELHYGLTSPENAAAVLES